MRNQRGSLVMAPRAGFEPATIRLTVECSTAELPRNRRTWFANSGAYNKGFRRCKGPNDPFRRHLKGGRKPPVLQGFVGILSRANAGIRAASAQARHLPTSWGSREIDSIRLEPLPRR